MIVESFIADESGAITIDWVALAAGIMIVSAGLVGLLTEELQTVGDTMEVYMLKADKIAVPVEN